MSQSLTAKQIPKAAKPIAPGESVGLPHLPPVDDLPHVDWRPPSSGTAVHPADEAPLELLQT